jgi:hypothetical protein
MPSGRAGQREHGDVVLLAKGLIHSTNLAEYHGLTKSDLCADNSPASRYNHQYVTPITKYKPPAMKP